MAALIQGNEIARRVVDDLIEFSGKTIIEGYMNFFKAQQISESRRFVNRKREEAQNCRNQIAQLNALIAKIEAFDDSGEVFDRLMGLRDDDRVEDAKLMGLNDMIAQAEEEIKMKEAQLEVADGGSYYGYGSRWFYFFCLSCVAFVSSDMCFRVMGLVGLLLVFAGTKVKVVRKEIYIFTLSLNLLTMAALYILDKLTEVADSSHLQDKIKVVFIQACGTDKSFIALMRDLCSALRVSIAKNRRLIAELETLGQRAEALKPLYYMKEIVGCDAATLGVLEQLLVGTHVGMRLKASYVAAMEETD
ncbi:hypothetical protein Tco_1314545 [Tanacetum coccineum]